MKTNWIIVKIGPRTPCSLCIVVECNKYLFECFVFVSFLRFEVVRCEWCVLVIPRVFLTVNSVFGNALIRCVPLRRGVSYSTATATARLLRYILLPTNTTRTYKLCLVYIRPRLQPAYTMLPFSPSTTHQYRV